MRTRIQKWGNSLALRIPKPFAEEVQLVEDSSVEVRVRDGELVVVLLPEPVTLEELLARVSDENLHTEIATGKPVGEEAW
ncbi:MAG TPA: AbrB/MazE/SpoVT family DNA-binding domain-containing protein [Thermoanaerobaculia bacterium]|nr:AbrB/MazE/SpoVT family DNA-binding domain-containing protein [Thermoanaerobaculia bacterium]